MSNLRWKWIGYHIYSNLLTLGLTLVLLLVFFWASGEIPLSSLVQFVLVSMVGATLLGAICGFKFSKNLRNRLEEISIGAKTLAYGNLNYRLPFNDDKEIGDIALAFNEMAKRLEVQVTALQKLAAENQDLVIKTKSAAVTEERQRLARDLHDSVSQELFAITMTAATTVRLVEQNPEKCKGLILNIERSASKAQAEMRALLLQLRPATLDDQSLINAIASLAEELEAKHSLSCELQINSIELPNNIENQIYRVLQEAISNILRHAEATLVTIKLSQSKTSERIQLVVEDNGKGFNKEQIHKTSYGLQSIRERISELGGTVDWVTYPEQGTRIEVHIPIISTSTRDF